MPLNNQAQIPQITSLKHAQYWAPMSGQITSRINRLANDVVQEISKPRDKYNLADYLAMLEVDPSSKACVELKALRAVTSLGNYQHIEKDLQGWVLGNFDSMSGDLNSTVGQLCSAMPLGFAVAEVNFTNKVPGKWGEWRLANINILDPTRVSFRGSKGQIDYVIYRDGAGRKRYIPYGKCIHVINGLTTTFNEPFGSAEARRAMPYYRAKQAMLAELVVAAKNQATGILTAYADSNDSVRVLGHDNKPIKNPDGSDKIVSAIESLAMQLQNIENSSVVVTDLKNKITPLQLPTGENFFNINLQFLNRQIMLSYGVSALMFDEGSSGGLGNSGVSQAHKSILDAQIEGVVQQLRAQILNQVIKPLLVFNYGGQYAQKLGTFEINASTDPNTEILKGNFLLSTMTSGMIPASDLAAQNALRAIAGIPPINADQQQQLLFAQAQVQAMQQQIAQQPTADPNDQSGQGGYP